MKLEPPRTAAGAASSEPGHKNSVLYVESDFHKMSVKAALAETGKSGNYGGTGITCRPRSWGICAKPQDQVRQDAMDKERGEGPAKKDRFKVSTCLQNHPKWNFPGSRRLYVKTSNPPKSPFSKGGL